MFTMLKLLMKRFGVNGAGISRIPNFFAVFTIVETIFWGEVFCMGKASKKMMKQQKKNRSDEDKKVIGELKQSFQQ